MMRVICLQHEPFEGPAAIGTWLVAHGHKLTTCQLYAGEPLPPAEAFDALVMMGGGMSVNDESQLPWLVAEKALVRQAIARGKPVLGVCLGAQMIASALGAKVYRNTHREVGWFPVRLTEQGAASRLFGGFPRQFVPCHWHGETFDLPAGAVLLATTDACRHQAFAVGKNVVGLQFHLEYTPQSVELMLRHCLQDTTTPGPFVQNAAALREGCATYAAESQRLMAELLDKLLAE